MSVRIVIASILLAFAVVRFDQLNRKTHRLGYEIVETQTIIELKQDVKEQLNVAQVLMKRFEHLGLKHPRVILAQITEETGHQRSKVFNQNNNCVGMKRNKRGYCINPPGRKRPRDCECYDWDLHACYNTVDDCLKDYADWQKLVLTGYKQQYNRYPSSDEEYIAMLDSLYFPGSNTPRRYASNPKYRENITRLWKQVAKYAP